MHLISILMPVKNAAPFLKACIASILRQTHPRWELITIDDHSRDQSADILRSFARQDQRIKVFTNSGQGIIPALQQALEASSGHCITRMDSDDMMVPERLEKMTNLLIESHPDTIVTGLVKYFSDEPVSEGYLKYEAWLNEVNLSGTQWENIYRECVVASPNWMVYRKTLDQVQGFDALSYPEDYHLVLKWYQKRLPIRTIPETTLQWREHPARTSRNSPHYAQEAFFDLKINTFLQTDWRNGDLALWGQNEKTKLTSMILTKAGIPFHAVDLKDYLQTEKLNHPQVLVGVYPDEQERTAIEDYLNGIGLIKGRDWWYL